MFVIPLLAALTMDFVPEPPCSVKKTASYARISELPDGVAPFVAQMADAGERFNAGDVIIDKRVPQMRFISAHQEDCHLMVVYEKGGIVLERSEKMFFIFGPDGWAHPPPPYGHPPYGWPWN
jgi:hypothetical protein